MGGEGLRGVVLEIDDAGDALIEFDGIVKWHWVFQENFGKLNVVQEAMQSCMSRRPVAGDKVKTLAKSQKAEDANANKHGWKVAHGQIATVLEVDEAGDFRLRNAQGIESGWQYRRVYCYCDTKEAADDADTSRRNWNDNVSSWLALAGIALCVPRRH